MSFEFGDVVLVPFPFTSQVGVKRRPDVVVMAITSQLRPTRGIGEVWLNDWQEAGLLKPSAVKAVLATLEQRLVLRVLGHLAARDQRSLRDALNDVIG